MQWKNSTNSIRKRDIFLNILELQIVKFSKCNFLAVAGYIHDIHIIYVYKLINFFSFLLDYKAPESKKLIFTCWVALYRTEICFKIFTG